MLRYVANNETQTTRKPLRHKKWLVQITVLLWISKQTKKETAECQLIVGKLHWREGSFPEDWGEGATAI